MGSLQVWHWVVIAVIIVLLFGSKRLPDAARGLGRSMRILKAETKGLMDEDHDDKRPQVNAAPPAVSSTPQPDAVLPTPQPPSTSPSQAAPRDTSI